MRSARTLFDIIRMQARGLLRAVESRRRAVVRGMGRGSGWPRYRADQAQRHQDP